MTEPPQDHLEAVGALWAIVLVVILAMIFL